MKKAFVAIFTICIIYGLHVNAEQIADPSAYMMPAPIHETAPLADMIYIGYPDNSTNVAQVQSPVVIIGEEERDLLASLIMHEAGNQDYYGKRLIAAVVFNRINDPRFPNTVSDVIFQKDQFTTSEELGKVIPTDECYAAIDTECMERSDTEILYFNCNKNVYGTFLYKYGGHWFAK